MILYFSYRTLVLHFGSLHLPPLLQLAVLKNFTINHLWHWLSMLQNRFLCMITGTFYTASITAMEIEMSIPIDIFGIQTGHGGTLPIVPTQEPSSRMQNIPQPKRPQTTTYAPHCPHTSAKKV